MGKFIGLLILIVLVVILARSFDGTATVEVPQSVGVRVLTPGPDSQFGTSDDQVVFTLQGNATNGQPAAETASNEPEIK